MEIEIDLEKIKKLAKMRDDDNVEFRSFLKQHDKGSSEIDAIVHRITAEVSSQIDCTKCANCCKQIKPILDKDDVARFTSGLDVPVADFRGTYLIPLEDDPSKHAFNRLPCPFLQDDLCSNYEFRPEDCSSYPHLHKDHFVSRLWGVIENYGICPIVFNVFERLKAELWIYVGVHEDDFLGDIWD